MSGAARGRRLPGDHRVTAVGLVLAASLLLAGCPSPGRDAGPTTTEPPAPGPEPVLPAPVTSGPDDGRATTGPSLTVDLAAGGGSPAGPLHVVGTPGGGAVVLLGEPPAGPVTHVVTVAADGRRTGSLPLPGFASAWDLHLLPDSTALVTGRLATDEALGYAVVNLATGAARTVAAVPLDRATVDAVGSSAVSPDGGTVWLYSGTLVDGTYLSLLTGHDVATGGLVASRDLFAELRAVHDRNRRLDVVGLTGTPDGGVVLLANTFPPGAVPLPSPMLLAYDSALEPLAGPIAVGPQEAGAAATALVTAADGTTFVLVRGSPDSTLVAFPPGGPGPTPLLAVTGFRFADELAIDRGRAVLPGRVGARSIDLATGATTDVDVGCAGAVTVLELASTAAGSTWMLGGCFEVGTPPSVLWSIP